MTTASEPAFQIYDDVPRGRFWVRFNRLLGDRLGDIFYAFGEPIDTKPLLPGSSTRYCVPRASNDARARILRDLDLARAYYNRAREQKAAYQACHFIVTESRTWDPYTGESGFPSYFAAHQEQLDFATSCRDKANIIEVDAELLLEKTSNRLAAFDNWQLQQTSS